MNRKLLFDSSRPLMHKCTVCSRSFSTRGTLNRHQQNHKHSRHFTCSTCQVTFRRRDLLTRHIRIHDACESDKVEDVRRRSRRACSQCRDGRVKCSGQLPCDRCERKGKDCSYSSDGMRTSVNHLVSGSYLPDTGGATCFDRTIDGREEDHVSLPDLAVDHASLIINTTLDPEANADINISDQSPDAILWPWLHEDLFLQHDVNIDWFDISGSINQAEATIDSHLHLYNQNCPSSHDVEPTRERRHNQLGPASNEIDFVDPRKLAAVEALVSAASLSSKSKDMDTRLGPQHSSFFSGLPDICIQIETAFELSLLEKVGGHALVLDYPLRVFLQLFEKHFWPLWPFTPYLMFETCDFDPLLYLAMVSIGAMYGTRQAGVFGSVLHVRLRDELVNPLLDIDVTRKCMLSLGQARSLTQAAALYFGQKKAFSYAQHLGGTLVAQARKMSLFSATESEALSRSEDITAFVDGWIVKESRKRLAFAILRLEMYTSVLHSTRPLVSGREMDIGLPCSHELWSTSFKSKEAFAAAINQESFVNSPQLSYSDLVNIASDPIERLPHLKMLHLELLMNAMQEQVWASWSAKSSLARLTSSDGADIIVDMELEAYTEAPLPATTVGEDRDSAGDRHVQSLDAHFALGFRKMTALRTTLRSAISALTKIRNDALDFTRIRSSGLRMGQADRSSLLSCLLIYHLAFIQLSAPLRSIHQICHSQRIVGVGGLLDADATSVQAWAGSNLAVVAVRHARSIYNLLKAETEKPRDGRASVNFLTMIGLYNSAAVTWVKFNLLESEDSQQQFHQTPSMADFEQVLHDINPAWAGRSSFSTVIQKLRRSNTAF